MNDITERPRLSLGESMAHKYGMEWKPFEATLRATVVPPQTTYEQLAAFLLVAKRYDLDPITREIYAFPTRQGGIQPIVSIDGWMSIINSHPQMNGLQFEDIYANGDLIGIKATIHRKDRAHPTEVTEYMAECRRDTEPWKKWPVRMLRHKAAIQCARYAFGFSGIIDPDEYERFGPAPAERKAQAQANDPHITYDGAKRQTKAQAAERFKETHPSTISGETIDPDTGEVIGGIAEIAADNMIAAIAGFDLDAFLEWQRVNGDNIRALPEPEFRRVQDAITARYNQLLTPNKREETMVRNYDEMKPSSTPPSSRDVESAADAYRLGQDAHLRGAKRDQWPGRWQDQANIEAWIEGWDSFEAGAKERDPDT